MNDLHDPGWRPGWLPGNGTEGAMFEDAWCRRCAGDHGWHVAEDGESCPIWLAALLDAPGPAELERHDDGRTRCTVFAPCGCEPPRGFVFVDMGPTKPPYGTPERAEWDVAHPEEAGR